MVYKEVSIPKGRILCEKEARTVTAEGSCINSVPTLIAEGIRHAHACTHARTYVDTQSRIQICEGTLMSTLPGHGGGSMTPQLPATPSQSGLQHAALGINGTCERPSGA